MSIYFLTENNIRGEKSTVMGDIYVHSNESTQVSNIDSNNLYKCTTSQTLSTGTSKN